MIIFWIIIIAFVDYALNEYKNNKYYIKKVSKLKQTILNQ